MGFPHQTGDPRFPLPIRGFLDEGSEAGTWRRYSLLDRHFNLNLGCIPGLPRGLVGIGRSGAIMLQVKDTLRATVHLTFDGRVLKTYHGPDAAARFEKEVKVLRYLEERGCGFVPRLLEADPVKLRIITTNCGVRVAHLDPDRAKELFAELESFGVRHDDADMRNVTYRQSDGRFCVIDFEFATLLSTPSLPTSPQP